jgi:nitrogen-specific signal transduction histidine kinase/CheY-like chemotaxis protein
MSRAAGVLCENYRQGLKRRTLEEKQKQLEAQVHHAQKMDVLGRLAGGVAHDFNNLLMVLSGSAELLDRSLPREMLPRIYLEQIQRSLGKAATLTRQLLAFSRKQVLDLGPMDLHEAVHEVATMLPTLLGTDVEVILRDGAARAWIRSDLAQIEQVLINLAVNARDAMPGGGKLLIYTNNSAQAPPSASHAAPEVSDWVVLHVEDNGVGMDSQVLSQIFDPFFTTKPTGKGTGLGLSAVYGIVQQSSGHIHVESEPGHGTQVTLYFPTIDAPTPLDLKELPTASRQSGARATLLLVDDEPALRHAIGEILRESGYVVLDAPGPHVAVEIAREHPGAIDLLVTDVIMPGMRGPELHQRVLELQPHIQVLFMSGYAEGLPEIQLPAGAAFLQKPFSFASLLQALRALSRAH